MRRTNIETWITTKGLEKMPGQRGRSVYRRIPFGDVKPLDQIEGEVRSRLREIRSARGIRAIDLCGLVGLGQLAYRRHEISKGARMPVSRLIHLCEVLDANPAEFLFDIAPHVWGTSMPAAELVLAILRQLTDLDERSLLLILALVENMKPNGSIKRINCGPVALNP